MPTKRTLKKARRFSITQEAVEAYRRDDYLGLHRALGLRPWETSPLWADHENCGQEGTARAITWPQAVELRRQLEAALKDESHK